MRRSILTTAALIALSVAAPARADDIAGALAEAQRAYQGGQVQAAQTAVQRALELLQQRGAGDLAAALPAPLAGWTAGEARTTAGGGAGVLGGSMASRSYRNAQRQTVEIEVMSNNPMVGQLAAVLRDPASAQALGQPQQVGTLRAIQARNGDLQMMVGERTLVRVRGTAPAEAKMEYARAIDVARLAGN